MDLENQMLATTFRDWKCEARRDRKGDRIWGREQHENEGWKFSKFDSGDETMAFMVGRYRGNLLSSWSESLEWKSLMIRPWTAEHQPLSYSRQPYHLDETINSAASSILNSRQRSQCLGSHWSEREEGEDALPLREGSVPTFPSSTFSCSCSVCKM